jgi:hypothetical protein
MPDRKTLPRNPRKRSFKAGFVLALPFIGIALGFLLTHLTTTSTESQVPSLLGGNHGSEPADVRAIVESPDANSWMRSPGEEEVDDAEASIADAVSGQSEELGLEGDALASLLYEFAQITPEDIPPTLSIQEFTAHVAAIATKDIWTAKERGPLPEDPSVTDIRFGTSPRQSESTESPRTRFSTYDTRIYAVFDTSAYAHPGVLVKWCRIDQPELLILQKYEIDPHAASNYVWYKTKEGWPNGQYRVEVYSLGESFRLMSSGQYEIWQN